MDAKLQRLKIEAEPTDSGFSVELVEPTRNDRYGTGDYCRYDDAEAIIEELEERIVELEDEVAESEAKER